MTEPQLQTIGIPGRFDELTAEIAGSKAALLARMARLGLTVPPAFVLPTTLCRGVNQGETGALAALERGLREGIAALEQATGRTLGDARAPLLVSVRSGAAKSMPGMLSTILDVGLNGATVRGLIGLTGNPRLAWDSYRRFIQMYAEVVDDVPARVFEARLATMIRAEGAAEESDLDSEALERLTQDFAALAAQRGRVVPEDPLQQLSAASRAVYRSWEGARAKEYRRLNRLDALLGTAVTIQAMVFGNCGGRSGAGVAFSRNPATGAKELYVDFLADAQGEDVVSGRRMPSDAQFLAARQPLAAQELAAGAARLEQEFADAQDIEFTIEEGRLFFLQTRAAKRTPRAALRILVDLVREGLLDRAAALQRLTEIDLDHIQVTRFAADGLVPVATAISASPGVASGRIAFDSRRAQALAQKGEPVILLRPDTSTEDVAGFAVAAGILTAMGGRTAHAAVVARQLGKVCLVGCHALTIDDDARRGTIAGEGLAEGDWISLDGDSGAVTLGKRTILSEMPEEELAAIAAWRRAES